MPFKSSPLEIPPEWGDYSQLTAAIARHNATMAALNSEPSISTMYHYPNVGFRSAQPRMNRLSPPPPYSATPPSYNNIFGDHHQDYRPYSLQSHHENSETTLPRLESPTPSTISPRGGMMGSSSERIYRSRSRQIETRAPTPYHLDDHRPLPINAVYHETHVSMPQHTSPNVSPSPQNGLRNGPPRYDDIYGALPYGELSEAFVTRL